MLTAHEGMVRIPGGRFRMGSEDFYPEERPVHEVALTPAAVGTPN